MTSLRDRAAKLDRLDRLRPYRDQFVIDDDLVYLDGNSLGRTPRAAVEAVATAVTDEWAGELVMGWDRWLDLGIEVGDQIAPLIGAGPGEVAVGDQTSVNLYKLAMAALEHTDRRRILTDAGNFPSDLYILDSVAAHHGGELIVIDHDPSPEVLEHHVDGTIGLVALTHVSYRSGVMHDGATVSRLARSAGALMLWDLAHSVGAVEVDLTHWGADMAVGCTYKYLNGGPGAPGFLYVAPDLQEQLRQPITGWFGHADQFAFAPDFTPSSSIRRFLVGTPPILSLTAAREGVALTSSAGIEAIRAKGTALTSLFIDAVSQWGPDHGLDIATPLEPERRGAHVSLRHANGYQISKALRDAGVIVDFRAPDLIRFGFAALYTSHADAVLAAEVLRTVLVGGTWRDYPDLRSGVT